MESNGLTWQREREQRVRWDVSASNYEKWWPVCQRAALHISDRLVAACADHTGATFQTAIALKVVDKIQMRLA